MLGARLQKGEHQQAASSILQDLHLLMQKTPKTFRSYSPLPFINSGVPFTAANPFSVDKIGQPNVHLTVGREPVNPQLTDPSHLQTGILC